MRWLLVALLLTAAAAVDVVAQVPVTPAAADEAIAPFLPGDGAALTRRTCTRCHGANLVIGRHFDAASAERYWRAMVGTDPNSVEARTVITYLSTVLGEDNDGPDAALR